VNVDDQNPEYTGKIGGLLNVAAALEIEATQATATPIPVATPTPMATPLPVTTPIFTPTPTPTVLVTTSVPEENEPQMKTYLPLVMR
jgi:hypothetical protein